MLPDVERIRILIFGPNAEFFPQSSLGHMNSRVAELFGAAGSGKSVVVKTAMGLVRATSGRVELFGQDITNMPEEQLFEVRSQVGVLFQEGGLFDSLTIEENVEYPLLNQRVAGTQVQVIGVAEDDLRARIRDVAMRDAFDGTARPDRHEGRRLYRAVRRHQCSAPCGTVGVRDAERERLMAHGLWLMRLLTVFWKT